MGPRQGSHAVALGALVALIGCGGAPPPTERLTSSEAAVRAAAEVGGENVPQAALHLKLAREQVAAAKALIDDGETERAEMVLTRAQADAELALALARENTAKTDAQQTMDQVAKLRGGKK